MKKTKGILVIAVTLLLIMSTSGITADGHPTVFAGKAISQQKIVYVSTLGEFLSYTYDFFDDDTGGSGKYYQKLYNDHTLIFTQDMDADTDTSWHEYVPDWQTYGWHARATCANIEGNGYTIKNLWAKPDVDSNGPRYQVAFIEGMQDNFVRNLNIIWDSSKMVQFPNPIPEDYTKYRGDYAGLVYSAHNSTISNIHVKGDFYLTGKAAGIVAWPTHSVIEHCSFEGDLLGSGVGGIVAFAPKNEVRNCFYKGNLYGVGAGGIADRPRGGEFADGPSGDSTYETNIAIVESLTEINFPIYISEYKPRGTFFGDVIEKWEENVIVKGNYVLDVAGVPHASLTYGDADHIGAATGEINYNDDEVKTLDSISDFSIQSNFSELDFNKHWYMDTEKGYPQLKKNFISIINLSDEKFEEDFQVQTDKRYYTNDDGVGYVQSTISDSAACRLIYFTLDGVDVLGSISPNSLPLLMDSSHTLVIKAAASGNITFTFENLATLKVNGMECNTEVKVFETEYFLGDSFDLEFTLKGGYELIDLVAENGYSITENDGKYSLSIAKVSTLEMTDINVAINTRPLQNGPDNAFIYYIIGGVCGAGIIVVIITLSRKRIIA